MLLRFKTTSNNLPENRFLTTDKFWIVLSGDDLQLVESEPNATASSICLEVEHKTNSTFFTLKRKDNNNQYQVIYDDIELLCLETKIWLGDTIKLIADNKEYQIEHQPFNWDPAKLDKNRKQVRGSEIYPDWNIDIQLKKELDPGENLTLTIHANGDIYKRTGNASFWLEVEGDQKLFWPVSGYDINDYQQYKEDVQQPTDTLTLRLPLKVSEMARAKKPFDVNIHVCRNRFADDPPGDFFYLSKPFKVSVKEKYSFDVTNGNVNNQPDTSKDGIRRITVENLGNTNAKVKIIAGSYEKKEGNNIIGFKQLSNDKGDNFDLKWQEKTTKGIRVSFKGGLVSGHGNWFFSEKITENIAFKFEDDNTPQNAKEFKMVDIDNVHGYRIGKWWRRGLPVLAFLLLAVLFTAALIFFLNTKYYPSTKNIATCKSIYGDGTAVSLCISEPINVESVALVGSGTPIPLPSPTVTNVNGVITYEYPLPADIVSPLASFQNVTTTIDGDFRIVGSPWQIDCNSSIVSPLFCTKRIEPILIYFEPMILSCELTLVTADGSKSAPTSCETPLNYTAWFNPEGQQIRKGSISIAAKGNTSDIHLTGVSVAEPISLPAVVDAPFPDFAIANGAPQMYMEYTYTITANANDTTISKPIQIRVLAPWVTTSRATSLFASPYLNELKQTLLQPNTPLLAISSEKVLGLEGNGWLIVRNALQDDGGIGWVKTKDILKSETNISLLPPPATVPVEPSATSTPVTPTPLPPGPTATPTPEFRLMGSSGKYADTNTQVFIYLLVAENSGSGNTPLPGYSLRLIIDGRTISIGEVSTSVLTQTKNNLSSSLGKPVQNLMYSHAFEQGPWEIQLVKDGTPVAAPVKTVELKAEDNVVGRLPSIYVRYCKGNGCD